jgi:TPR repeat protein
VNDKDDSTESLVLAQPVAPSLTGTVSLVTRGLHDLLEAETADAWHARGCELWRQDKWESAVACYRRGLEVNPNHAELQFEMGRAYNVGGGVARDETEAVRWYRKAAEQGNAEAQRRLGLMYENGRGVPKDDGEAVRWFRKAAEQGDSGAQCDLGRMYEGGRGVTKDHVQAALWYDRAEGQGAYIWWRKAHNKAEAMRRENLEKRKP